MRPLVSALAASLILAVAACGGNDGAKSAGPAPSVPVETAPPAESARNAADAAPAASSGNAAEEHLDDPASAMEAYVAQADAICNAATDKLEAALTELDQTDQSAREIAKQELAFRISGEALAELRALPPPDVPAVTPVALCSHRTGTQESASGSTRAEYIAQANEICRAANGSFDSENFPPRGLEVAEIAEARARIEDEALAELRALPQPEADRALLEEGFYQVVEQEIYAHRALAAAIRAGNDARRYLLGLERVHLTHQRDLFTYWYGLAGGCPLALPA
jgi:hypothetical protein